MIDKLIETVVDPVKMAVVAISGSTVGTVANESSKILGNALAVTETSWVDIALSRTSWTIAIIAGILSVIFTIKKLGWFNKNKK